ncbi:MAG: cation diffusion facilitator family transporter [Deltaproteobacteria bacterium]|nr:cation diffusion facilitator family transporter [Deltaproteobacteria bacterium]NND28861.1 cation diffusion facilitator family transporter [Myxococcales bacterium]MBT8464819.1 cation diffusion facilitator family transporter [Deltaproteobacteria bacterium]MBT8482337.1 cation diffusion facilitator family transporter [Deltaproteobacteria bacterium]NNK06351.1 cation diffusion facilitator family transporter [Myxococcales bacterium]
MTTSTRAVAIALLVDLVVGAFKLVAFLLTGSTAIMAEVLHSAADLTNQSLLAVGIAQSQRAPDRDYPYGFGRSRYIWAMLSAAGVLFVGSGVSVVNGAQQIWAPEPLEHLDLGFLILLVSIAAESISLAVGWSSVRRSARQAGQSIWQYLRKGPDPMGVAVVLEDASAVLGVLIAMTGLALAELTGNPAWDGAASVGIGVLLGASAIFLINRNRRHLLGAAPPTESVAQMTAVLEESPLVARIQDVKASQLGADSVRFKAEVTFDGRELARRLLLERDLEATWTTLNGPQALERLLVEFGGEVTDAIGDEIDRLEEELTEVAPEARHVDLEPD